MAIQNNLLYKRDPNNGRSDYQLYNIYDNNIEGSGYHAVVRSELYMPNSSCQIRSNIKSKTNEKSIYILTYANKLVMALARFNIVIN